MATIDIQSLKKNLVLNQGTDWSTDIDVIDQNGDVFDLSGFFAEGQMRKNYASVHSTSFDVVELDDTGRISIALDNVATSALKPGRYMYDIEITDPTGIITRVAEGIVTVRPNFTRPMSTGHLPLPNPIMTDGPEQPVTGPIPTTVLAYKGDTGEQGDQGVRGLQGMRGPIGVPGKDGARGERGLRGHQGKDGEKGERGEIGEYGARGPRGDRGERGHMGVGQKGDTGGTGPMGPQGPEGQRGASGPMGISGVDGPSGPIGPIGKQGPVGSVGPAGPKGDKGNRGARGSQGSRGLMGPPGPMGDIVPLEDRLMRHIKELQAEIKALKKDIYNW